MKTSGQRVKEQGCDDTKWKTISGIVVIVSVFTFLTIMGIVYSPMFG